MNEISLALSGGAARGAYHLGVLQFIDESNIKIKAISATSIGSIIGASYAAGITPKEQLKIYKSKEFRDIFSFNFFNKSIFKINAQATILKELIPVDTIEELNIPLFITAMDIDSGENICFTQGELSKICLASSALLPVFAPVEYQNKKLIDGGTVNHMPITPLQAFSYPIVGVNLHPIFPVKTGNNIFSTLKRAVKMNAFSNTLSSKELCDIYIATQEIEKFSLFSFKHLDTLFELGYRDAKKILIL